MGGGGGEKGGGGGGEGGEGGSGNGHDVLICLGGIVEGRPI